MVDKDNHEWESLNSSKKDTLSDSIKLTDLQKNAIRSLYGLDDTQSLNLSTISEKMSDDFKELQQSNLEARPHIELEINPNDFTTALDQALNGESTSFDLEKSGSVELDPHLDHGFVDLNVYISSFEMAFEEYETGASTERLSEEELEIIEEHYASGSIHIQQEPSTHQGEFAIPLLYVTLLRDMSEDCHRVADVMNRVVDEYEGLFWEEPRLFDIAGSYVFAGRLHYRSR